MDKPMVEVTEAKKELNTFYSIRGFLVADCLNLLRVNFNSFYTNDKPKVLCSKFTFLNINL